MEATTNLPVERKSPRDLARETLVTMLLAEKVESYGMIPDNEARLLAAELLLIHF